MNNYFVKLISILCNLYIYILVLMEKIIYFINKKKFLKT